MLIPLDLLAHFVVLPWNTCAFQGRVGAPLPEASRAARSGSRWFMESSSPVGSTRARVGFRRALGCASVRLTLARVLAAPAGPVFFRETEATLSGDPLNGKTGQKISVDGRAGREARREGKSVSVLCRALSFGRCQRL